MRHITIIQKQVIAYNERNLNDFVACHAENVELYTFPNTTPNIIGRAALIEKYKDIFDNSPNLHTEILNRIVIGNTVIDHENITGRKDAPPTKFVAIYEVENGLIAKARFIKEEI